MPPTPLRLIGVTPTLTCDEVPTSADWYTRILGFEIIERFEDDRGRLKAAWLRAGECTLFLGHDDGARGSARSKGEGLRLYFEIDEDIDALAAAIVARGGVLDHEPMDRAWGSRDFSVTDPSGFRLSFSSRFPTPT